MGEKYFCCNGFLRTVQIFCIAGLLMMAVNLQAQTGKEKGMDTIVLGSGCFWCSQALFERVEGVVSAVAGYSGGEAPYPSYEQVCRGNTGYAEVVQVVYDPSVVHLGQLLEIFWKTHNPTTLNRQGADVGTQYRSVIFYRNARQKAVAQTLKQKLEEAKIWPGPIVTEVSPCKNFYPAEPYHQDYYKKNPSAGYCQFVITPKVKKFEQVFREMLKNKQQ